jgi:hypothetical protein
LKVCRFAGGAGFTLKGKLILFIICFGFVSYVTVKVWWELRKVKNAKKMIAKIKYEFTARIWKHPSPDGWYFVSLPKAMADEIREHLKWLEAGWGRLKATARIGNSEWETAVWFDTKYSTYLLPVKAEIRKKERIEIDRTVDVLIWI